MPDSLRQTLRRSFLEEESMAIPRLLDALSLPPEDRQTITDRAAALVRRVRKHGDPGVMQSFLAEYGLSTSEGVALMCLAEALLRVPDAETIDELIQDKIVPHDWASHIGDSGSILVNASTWALLLTGRMLEDEADGVVGALRGVVRRLGEPVVRRAVEAAMREMGEQFVLGRDIVEATQNGNPLVGQGYTYSYDMLGEAARTEADARRYQAAYLDAINFIATRAESDDLRENPGISVKLSALHPRYEYIQRRRMLPEMCKRLLELCHAARDSRVGLNIDAEEADRLDLSLEVISGVLPDPSLAGWDGFGVVVQAYGQRALHLIEWLHQLARDHDRRIMVRLVKGAYWDTEIKRAQVNGLEGFPVFTRKTTTDVSYLACARRLLSMRERIYPQFATHNAHTVSAILHLAGEIRDDFEFQRLHGMGDVLHDIVRRDHGTRCRIYAPVGTHEDLLAYLVRRLLENGANSSFVNQIVDEAITPEEIARDPVSATEELACAANPMIPSPADIYAPSRRNSRGFDINDPLTSQQLLEARAVWEGEHRWVGNPDDNCWRVFNPANRAEAVGEVSLTPVDAVEDLVAVALDASGAWSDTAVEERAACLHRAADLYETHNAEFFALLAREAGKTLDDAIAELREAVDFLRYYATGAIDVERETTPRGSIVCISPWNFPLAIFTGQIAAALVTGNTVLAKPAEQTPLVARRAVSLLHQAGIPEQVLQLVIGEGETVGAALTAHPAIAGVCFTGSTEVATRINRQLARTAAADAMLIAETGGINAMIVDSTALLEQVVTDIVEGAFRSAGQRCSALRVLCVQSDIRDRLLEMLKGAMDVLVVGDPLRIETDVGPVIDAQSAERINTYCDRCAAEGRLLHRLESSPGGYFVAPALIGVNGIDEVREEVFGPVLHVATFAAEGLVETIAAINRTGYGLTFGLHTRIDRRVQEVVNAVHAGNLYINRNQIGAIVGSQPFGGEGLSGTGPKAGGPHYLRRFRRGTGEAGAAAPAGTVPGASPRQLARAVDRLLAAPAGAISEMPRRLRDLLRGRASAALAVSVAMDSGPLDLPGPTGESNQLSLHPLGLVICLSHDPLRLMDMTVQALRAGNRVLAVGADARRHLTPLRNREVSLAVVDGELDPDGLGGLAPDAVAADTTQDLVAIRRALARIEGPIIRLLTERFHPAGYALERAICIDTTAAGGNAALLAASSDPEESVIADGG